MKKKKIFIALLASLCVSAGAAGLAACKPESAEGRDSALYNLYQKYCETTDSPASYEEWLGQVLASIGQPGKQGEPGEPGEPGEQGEQGEDGLDGDGIEDISLKEIDGKQYFEFVFTSGKIIRIPADGTGEKIVSPSFTVKAVDQNGDPVKDAYFNIGYYDSSNYSTLYLKEDGTTVNEAGRADAYAFKTNSKGIATFYCFINDSDKEYTAYLASAESINIEGVSAIPAGYDIDFGEGAYGMKNTSVDFTKGEDGNYTADAKFMLSNSWDNLYDPSSDLQYTRYIPDLSKPDDIKEEYTPYVKKVTKNIYNYFTFAPRTNRPAGDNDVDEYNALMDKAASGRYRLSWKANRSSANVDLKYYNFFGGTYFAFNEDNSPSDTLILQRSGSAPNDNNVLRAEYERYSKSAGAGAMGYETWLDDYKSKFSGGNFVEIEVNTDQASAVFCLSYISDVSCEVTITVERIGDVAQWTDEYNEVNCPPNASQETDQEGSVKDVPLDAKVVKGSDNYYHLNDANGPVIYVQLKKATRVNSNSMEYLAAYPIDNPGPDSDPSQPSTGSVFIYTEDRFDEATNSGVHVRTDYTNVVKGYAAKANSDGLYRVNDLLLQVLKNYCRSFSSSYGEFYWVAACSYYGPVADGTENAPYEIDSLNNRGEFEGTLNSSGKTYFVYKPQTEGYYGFMATTQGASLEITHDGVTKIDNAHYLHLNALEEFVFSVSGTGEKVNLRVISFSSNTIAWSLSESNVESGTEEHPVAVTGEGVKLVSIDHTAYNHPINVTLSVLFGGDGTYKLTVYGSNNAKVLDENGEDIVDKNFILIYETTTQKITIDCPDNGYFYIKIEKVSSETQLTALNRSVEMPVVEITADDKTDGKKSSL